MYIYGVVKAFAQADSTLRSPIFVRAPLELQAPSGYVLVLLKPLYSIPESPLHWFVSYSNCRTTSVLSRDQPRQQQGVTDSSPSTLADARRECVEQPGGADTGCLGRPRDDSFFPELVERAANSVQLSTNALNLCEVWTSARVRTRVRLSWADEFSNRSG